MIRGMIKWIALVLLVLAACVPGPQDPQVPLMPEPREYWTPPAVNDARQPAIQTRAVVEDGIDPRVELVREFILNQNFNSLDEAIESVKKNERLATGYMLELLVLQQTVYEEQAEFAREWNAVYEKGKDVISEQEVQLAEQMIQETIRPRDRMNLQYDIESLELVGPSRVRATYVELMNFPTKKRKKALEDVYILEMKDGEYRVADVITEGARISDTSIIEIGQSLAAENKRDQQVLREFRALVGLKS